MGRERFALTTVSVKHVRLGGSMRAGVALSSASQVRAESEMGRDDMKHAEREDGTRGGGLLYDKVLKGNGAYKKKGYGWSRCNCRSSSGREPCPR